MVKEAIVSLKERDGSSVAAITKYIDAKYGKELSKSSATWTKVLSYQLKR